MDIKEYINSGILESYVLGLTNDQENMEISNLVESHPEIAAEVERITENIMTYSESLSPKVDVTIKPMLEATIDYMERIYGGEKVTYPPVLTESITPANFTSWLERPDMVLPADFEDFFAKIIGHSDKMTTAIAWLRLGAPHEVHHDQYEKFLVLEGTCDIVTDDGIVHSLIPGNYMSIPLHMGHYVKVTSDIPCKVILQR
ncbi:MAG TPA: cupin domain-containing protein, partial [Bacteroidia bacterium]